MKNILALFLAIIAFQSFSQSVLVDGYINNTQGNPVNLLIDRTYLGVKPEIITAKTNEGNFSFALHESKEFIASLSYGTESYSLFLSPNDTLHLAFTADLMNITIQLSGNAAAENLFLKRFKKKFEDNLTDTVMFARMMTTGVDAFEIDLFNNRKAQMDFFKADSSYSTFSPAFKTYITNLVTYRYWNLLLAYPIIRANSSATIMQVVELPPTMLDGFDKVTVSNAAALICDSYRGFLKGFVIYFTSKQNGFNKFTDFNLSMEKKNAFAKSAISDAPYQYWLSKFMLDDFEKAQPSTIKKLYNQLIQSDKQMVYASVVKDKCGAFMEKKDEEKKAKSAAPSSSGAAQSDGDYKIVNEKGKPVRFSDFKGKVVYVDFWASWCGPCRQEMPYSKELHKKFSEKQLKNIAFLYVSIDKDEDSWRKAVKEIGMEGVQGFSPANWSDGAGRFFQVNRIPRYLLIDKSGKVVDDNAKRPSDPGVFNDILNLLQ